MVAYPVFISVVRQTSCVGSTPFILIAAYRTFSSTTGSAISLRLVPGFEAEDEGRDTGFLPANFCCGRTERISFRVLEERFTTKTSQRKGSPTRTSPVAVKLAVMPMSARVLRELSVECFAEPEDGEGRKEGAVGVGRLAGRLVRCIDWPGLP